mmetsp:Transcript_2916/g.6986  ORF Transcript_2916/g.6986 Transcript_2916/m.6986 type:complete len:240 (+) Transcript_2916:77-796(+)
MLSISKKKAGQTKTSRSGPVKAPGRSQSLLAVARTCRQCGERLTALEDALHQCPAVFRWTFSAEAVGSAASTDGACRLVRLGACARRGAANARLEELWENIRDTQLSHILDLPSAERLASKAAIILLALRGKDVLALISAERIPVQHVYYWQASSGSKLVSSSASGPALGVSVIWTSRRQRRRGLARALVDCARKLTVPDGPVAFSQPTELGMAFAQRYMTTSRGAAEVLVYDSESQAA